MTTYTITATLLNSLIEHCDNEENMKALSNLTPNSGEAVGAQSKFKSSGQWGMCSIEHHSWVHGKPEEWLDYETRLIYDHPAPSTKPTDYHTAHCHQGEYPDTCKYGDADCTAAPQGETKCKQ